MYAIAQGQQDYILLSVSQDVVIFIDDHVSALSEATTAAVGTKQTFTHEKLLELQQFWDFEC